MIENTSEHMKSYEKFLKSTKIGGSIDPSLLGVYFSAELQRIPIFCFQDACDVNENKTNTGTAMTTYQNLRKHIETVV